MPLFGNKTELGVELDRDRLIAGESVRCHVTVGETDRKAQGGQVQLLYRNTYRYESVDSEGDRTSSRTTDDVVVASEPLFAHGEVSSGTVSVELPVPPRAPGSAAKSVEWLVRASVDRRMGRDTHADAPLTVLTPAETHADWAERPSTCPKECPMTIEAEPRTVAPGDRVRGRLEISPGSPLSGRGVRMQLRRRRNDQDGLNDEDVAVRIPLCDELELGGGESRTFDFELDVPVDASPSFEAKYNHQHWLLEGVVDRPRKLDYVAHLELNVHTA